MFAGTHTALVTPFRESDGEVDYKVLEKLVARQFDAGINGVVPVGTTGESPTLDHEEHLDVIAHTARFTGNRGMVIAGTGSNCTEEAVSLTQGAEKAGANAALVVAPYYNRPSQENLFHHFKTIADSTALPIILYNIPGRCGVDIEVETTKRLFDACPNIKGMKEAGGQVDRVSQLRQHLSDDFEILSGDDALTVPFVSVGARGVISVASNLIPAEMGQLVLSALQGNWETSQSLHQKYYLLFVTLLSLDSNPAPIKAALSLLGLVENKLRPPLRALNGDNLAILRARLQASGLISE